MAKAHLYVHPSRGPLRESTSEDYLGASICSVPFELLRIDTVEKNPPTQPTKTKGFGHQNLVYSGFVPASKHVGCFLLSLLQAFLVLIFSR